MIEEITLVEEEMLIGQITGNVLREFNPIKTSKNDLEDMNKFYGYLPLVEVEENGEMIGLVKWNNNLDTLYYDRTIGESAGITQLNDGKFVHIGYNYGDFNAQVIPKKEAYKLLYEAEILDNFNMLKKILFKKIINLFQGIIIP